MRETVLRLYDEVFNAGRPDVADEIVDPAFVLHNEHAGTARGPEAIKVMERSLRAGFPDLRFEVEDMVAEGDKVALRWRMLGTHEGEYMGFAPTGRRVRLQACVMFRVSKQSPTRLLELWPYVDTVGAQRQLAQGDV